MNRVFPMYEGDSIIHSPVTPQPHIDVVEVEAHARRLRAEWLGGMLARLFDRIGASVQRARYRELERYLSQSTDHADLERRLRHLGVERRNALAQG